MFTNLEVELTRKQLSKKDLSSLTEIEYKTLLNKMSGKTLFNCKDMMNIKNKVFPELTIDYLFDESVDLKRGD